MRYNKVKNQLEQKLKTQNSLSKEYRSHIKSFSDYMASKDLKRCSMEDIKANVQPYIDSQIERGYSADTIHTRVACISKAIGCSMSDFHYPKRGLSHRGRDDTTVRRNELNSRLTQFADRVGIREREYRSLKGSDFIERDGRAYVVVRKGKGGKYQEQLIADKDKDFVRSYFAGKKDDEYIFTRAECVACEHANLHMSRREHAQEMYSYYTDLFARDPEARDEYKELLRARFEENAKKGAKAFEKIDFSRPYIARGELREELVRNGRDYSFDRLALLCVSNLHLAHYRVNVCVRNYMR